MVIVSAGIAGLDYAKCVQTEGEESRQPSVVPYLEKLKINEALAAGYTASKPSQYFRRDCCPGKPFRCALCFSRRVRSFQNQMADGDPPILSSPKSIAQLASVRQRIVHRDTRAYCPVPSGASVAESADQGF